MTKDEIKEFLKNKPGYLKEGCKRLSERLETDVNECREALKEARIEMMHGFSNMQMVNVNDTVDIHFDN